MIFGATLIAVTKSLTRNCVVVNLDASVGIIVLIDTLNSKVKYESSRPSSGRAAAAKIGQPVKDPIGLNIRVSV